MWSDDAFNIIIEIAEFYLSVDDSKHMCIYIYKFVYIDN